MQKHDQTGCINGLRGKWLMVKFQFSYLQAGKLQNPTVIYFVYML